MFGHFRIHFDGAIPGFASAPTGIETGVFSDNPVSSIWRIHENPLFGLMVSEFLRGSSELTLFGDGIRLFGVRQFWRNNQMDELKLVGGLEHFFP